MGTRTRSSRPTCSWVRSERLSDKLACLAFVGCALYLTRFFSRGDTAIPNEPFRPRMLASQLWPELDGETLSGSRFSDQMDGWTSPCLTVPVGILSSRSS